MEDCNIVVNANLLQFLIKKKKLKVQNKQKNTQGQESIEWLKLY